MTALLVIAVLAAATGALWGFRWREPLASMSRNRTPLALLVSLAVCLFVIEPLDLSFDVLGLALDFAVIAVVVRKPIDTTPTRDIVILSLFAPAFVFYTMEPAVRYQGGFAVVVTQLLLTFPAEEAQHWLRARMKRGHGNGGDRLGFSSA